MQRTRIQQSSYHQSFVRAADAERYMAARNLTHQIPRLFVTSLNVCDVLVSTFVYNAE